MCLLRWKRAYYLVVLHRHRRRQLQFARWVHAIRDAYAVAGDIWRYKCWRDVARLEASPAVHNC